MKTIINFIKKILRKSRPNKIPPNDPAHTIARNKHQVSKTDISPNALQVLSRLNDAGFQAYLVGGSVRDLLLRKAPKDFDIATNATPNQIRSLFKNARVIGRRFKLVHILYHREIIEVATFRGAHAIDAPNTQQRTNDHGMLVRDNAYGTLEEDAWRRDFTVNSLYYHLDGSIIDYTGGVADVKQRLIRMIGVPDVRYQEDPVRMLRAIRFSAKLHFEIAPETAEPMHRLNELITHISGSRLFDEMTKLYQCGEAESVQRLLVQFGLFQHLFPQTSFLMSNSNYPINAFLINALESTDARIHDQKPVTPAFLYAVILWFPLMDRFLALQQEGTDPLPALDQAMSQVIAEQNQRVTIPKRFTQVMREIWLLQYRFSKRTGARPYTLLEHPRFRGAYDFLALRALTGDAPMALADWWTTFQDADDALKTRMIQEQENTRPKARRRRTVKTKPKPVE